VPSLDCPRLIFDGRRQPVWMFWISLSFIQEVEKFPPLSGYKR
jgi:hypothetical protein